MSDPIKRARELLERATQFGEDADGVFRTPVDNWRGIKSDFIAALDCLEAHRESRLRCKKCGLGFGYSRGVMYPEERPHFAFAAVGHALECEESEEIVECGPVSDTHEEAWETFKEAIGD